MLHWPVRFENEIWLDAHFRVLETWSEVQCVAIIQKVQILNEVRYLNIDYSIEWYSLNAQPLTSSERMVGVWIKIRILFFFERLDCSLKCFVVVQFCQFLSNCLQKRYGLGNRPLIDRKQIRR